MRTLYALSLVASITIATVAYADSVTYTQPTERTDGSPLGDDLVSSTFTLTDSNGAPVGQPFVFPSDLPNTGQEVTQPLPSGLLTPGQTYTASMVWTDQFAQDSVPDTFEFQVPLPPAPVSGAIKRVTIEFTSGVVQTIEAP